MTAPALNILMLASWFPNRHKPALGNFVQRHAAAVAAMHNVVTLSVCSGVRPGEGKYHITTRHDGPMYSVVVYYRAKERMFLPFRLWRHFIAFLKGYRVARNHFGGHPNLVHLHIIMPAGLFAWYLRRRYRIPTVVTEHSTVFQTGLGRWQRWFVRWVTRGVSAVCPVSDNLGEAMKRAGVRAPQHTVPNVVDTQIFRPASKTDAKKKRLLHVSTLNERQKNITGLLNAIARLAAVRNDFELHLVSELSTEAAEKKAAALGLLNQSVFIHPFMPGEEVAGQMRQSHVFVLFSRYENLPCVVLEAMASGIPVLSTDVGGIAEHLLPEFGMLIRSEDEDQLTDTLITMLDRPERFDTSKMRDYAVGHFSPEAVARGFHEVYTRVLKAPSPVN